MKGLIIDATGSELFLMLVTDKKYTYKISKNSRFHNVVLMPLMDEMLTENDLTIRDIDCVGCVTGPGSFTGIRIGASICNGLSYGAGLKKVDLNALALIYGEKRGKYLTAINARVNNYYYGIFEDGKLISSGDAEKEELYNLCDTVYIRDEQNPINMENYFAEFTEKVERGEFTDYFAPNYMKLSQAERLKK